MLRILFSNEDFLIVDKPKGMPTVPLKGQPIEGTLLGEVARHRTEVLDVRGRNAWEAGAVHRLDTPTSGLVIFSLNQVFHDHIMRIQEKDLFLKRYTAVTVEDDTLKGSCIPPHCMDYVISSYFRSFGPKGSQVRPTKDPGKADSNRIYETIVSEVSSINGETTYGCLISRGFRHQIRSHLAWCGHPIIGDKTYGGAKGEQSDSMLLLDCTEVSFPLSDGSSFVFSKTSPDAIM